MPKKSPKRNHSTDATSKSKDGGLTDATPVDTEAMSAKVQNILSDLLHTPANMQNFIATLVVKLTDVIKHELSTYVANLVAEITDIKTEVSKLKNDLNLVSDEVKYKLMDLEQYSRRNSVRLFGFQETKNEDCETILMDMCKEKLHLNITPSEIDRAHRVGIPSEGKHRPILIKFVSYKSKSKLMFVKKNLKGTGIVVREDLCRGRLAILNAAIDAFGLSNVWTANGNIVIRLPNGNRKYISSAKELSVLCNENNPDKQL